MKQYERRLESSDFMAFHVRLRTESSCARAGLAAGISEEMLGQDPRITSSHVHNLEIRYVKSAYVECT